MIVEVGSCRHQRIEIAAQADRAVDIRPPSCEAAEGVEQEAVNGIAGAETQRTKVFHVHGGRRSPECLHHTIRIGVSEPRWRLRTTEAAVNDAALDTDDDVIPLPVVAGETTETGIHPRRFSPP